MFHFSIIPFAQQFSAADTGEAPATGAVDGALRQGSYTFIHFAILFLALSTIF
jgi:hypothetical protein